MNSLFEDLKQGLEEAISYEQGTIPAKKRIYSIMPVKEYSNKEIREIRMKTGMTQTIFAYYMGVSKKTVEAWEGGRTHPTGPVFRLLEILEKENIDVSEYIISREKVSTNYEQVRHNLEEVT